MGKGKKSTEPKRTWGLAETLALGTLVVAVLTLIWMKLDRSDSEDAANNDLLNTVFNGMVSNDSIPKDQIIATNSENARKVEFIRTWQPKLHPATVAKFPDYPPIIETNAPHDVVRAAYEVFHSVEKRVHGAKIAMMETIDQEVKLQSQHGPFQTVSKEIVGTYELPLQLVSLAERSGDYLDQPALMMDKTITFYLVRRLPGRGHSFAIDLSDPLVQAQLQKAKIENLHSGYLVPDIRQLQATILKEK